MSWLTLASLGLSLFSGFQKYSNYKSAGQAGYNQGVQNAQDSLYFGQLNAGAAEHSAALNAGLTRELGELNAWYIERAGERNLKLYGIQADEELRRHIRAEKLHAGQVRAMAAGTGAQVNTGSNLYYLNDQINEGLNQRHFLQTKHFETKKSIKMNYMDQAYASRKSAELKAGVIEANGAIAADMALAQSQFSYNSYMSQANAAMTQGNAAANNELWGMAGNIGEFAIGGGFGDLAKLFNFGSSSAAAPPTYLAASSINSNAPPPLLSSSSAGGGIGSSNWASNFMGSL